MDDLAEMNSLRTRKIVIDDTIIFIPANRQLQNDLTGESAILHTPASYCLLSLLSNRSQILTKSELIKLSWNNNTQVITDNTFYQMVFHLRQSLAKVGGESVIITVPRRGLKINPDISVQIIGIGNQEPTPTTYNLFNSIPVIAGVISKIRKKNIFLILSSGVLFFLSAHLYTAEPDEVAFNDYHHQEYKMCTVSYNEEIDKENISLLLMKSETDCSQKKRIILSQSNNHSRTSVISCPAASTNIKSCSLSLYVQ
ncbi:transcriptional regulator [Cronobacter dublinensis]|uniref:winged helix-turn-helix domain-containing protein n=1 Tax=Cronobacter dublinensis TaxID=413497 RepID=UPI0035124F91